VELFEAINNRRSIRHYTTDPVDDDKVNKILEAGRWAPSWANTQCWRFVVVRDPEIKARISQSMMRIKRGDELSDSPGTKAINDVPVLIVVCAEMKKSGCKPGDATSQDFVTDKGDWFMFDTALAVQNMVLAAHGLGLGTVIMGAFDAPMVEEILGIPEGYRVVILLPLGVPAREGKAPPRKSLDEIAVRDRWES
jgi:nitroreductase